MKKIKNNQLDSKKDTFDPKGSLVVPKNANITITQPAVLMTAKAGSYLYALPPGQAKKDCQVEFSESKESAIPLYYFPDLEKGIQKWASSLNYGIILYLDDNKIKAISPDIGQLKNLSFLSIVQNGLVTIPEEIKELKSLTTFCCLYDNALDEASVEITRGLGNIVQG